MREGYLTSKMFCLLSFLVICFACKMQHAQEGQEPLQEGLLQVGKGNGVKKTWL